MSQKMKKVKRERFIYLQFGQFTTIEYCMKNEINNLFLQFYGYIQKNIHNFKIQ